MSETKPRILLVDDDKRLLRLLSIRLERDGYHVSTAVSGEQALAQLPAFQPQLLITDMRMEGMDGMALFDLVHAQAPMLPVIILTAHGTIPDAVSATRRGVFAYLTKPFEGDELSATVEGALKLTVGGPAAAQAGGEQSWRSEIITRSPAVEALLNEAARVAKSEASVLILGDSGTGKELLAKAIHSAGSRRDKRFIAVNCTAVPEALLESELFGHRKGSFTGASQSREGLFSAADGGTLFLDEVGDMPLAFQSKLLRALQEREIRPVGATDSVAVDVRVISATNKNLEEAIAGEDFREDLFYRLNVVTLDLPSLAERREDIPLLAQHFLAASSTQLDPDTTEVKGFASDAMEVLATASWPGNIRQLKNVVEQCVVLAANELIPASLVQRALRSKPRELLPFAEARNRFELDYLVHLLQITEGNVAQAAKLAERNRSEFYRLLRRHHLEPRLFRDALD
ncbi:MAG: sigma 54-interacting transcriptional regulator [Thiohalocapsa sp.]